MPQIYDDERFSLLKHLVTSAVPESVHPFFAITADHIKSFRMRYAVTNLSMAVRAYGDHEKADQLDVMVDTAMRKHPNLLPDGHEYAKGDTAIEKIAVYLRGVFPDSAVDSMFAAEDIMRIITKKLEERLP
jgi:hypothetical protein